MFYSEKKVREKLLVKDNNVKGSNYTMSFLHLSEQIQMIMKDKGLKSLLLTEVQSSENTNTIIINLGHYLSHNMGHKVLIIDANVRMPSVARMLNIPDSPGLIDILEEKNQLEDAIKDIGSNLYVLPTNKQLGNPTVLFNSQNMANIFNVLKENYDLILVASANLKNSSDTIMLATITDGTALIINEGEDNIHVVNRLISPLKGKNVNLVGIVFNNRTYNIPKIVYKVT